MKLPPLHPRRQLPVDSRASAPPSAFRTPHSALHTPRSEGAMALVITLILLAVITFMAIAFLVISRAEKGSVTTTTDQAIARLAADTAFERAQAELLAPIMCSSNPYNYGLIVSTNYINSIGFIPGLSHPTNVNYLYANGTPLKPGPPGYDFEQNLTSLLYNPRPPVFITNRVFGLNDFRYYLDLNRNGRYDTNGFQPVINRMGGFFDTNGNWTATITPGSTLSNFFVGDPEWIGGLEFPTRTHSADNRFVYRYAYMVVPVGNTLDLNYIHNYAKGKDPLMTSANGDFFFRNQGVGSWEINLAAFLVDLNTNYWLPAVNPYLYRWDQPTFNNSGAAFEDALALLRYRYAGNTGTLASVRTTFGALGVSAFNTDFIDGYCQGPAMLGTYWPGTPPDDSDKPRVDFPWSGANNTNHFFSIQEVFDPAKTSVAFANRLLSASTNLDSYNRYTYYRLLTQLGTDSAPEVAPAAPRPITFVDKYGNGNDLVITVTNHGYFSGDKVTIISGSFQDRFRISVIDANRFVLVDSAGSPITSGGNAAAMDPFENAKVDVNYDNINSNHDSFTPWDPASFFTSAADRMLRRQSGQFLNNIPVRQIIRDAAGVPIYTNNAYTASTHRILQLALNSYDATTNRPAGPGFTAPYPPTVLRPIFRKSATNTPPDVFIVGYRQVFGTNLINASTNVTSYAPAMAELDTGLNMDRIPVIGTPISPLDQDEPLVSGVPLIVGAKKGYPNFNEFAMQSAIQITRRFKYHRTSVDAPLETNQLYIVTITNNFGVEAWNSYVTNFPRPLQMIVAGYIGAELTNELGAQLVNNRAQFAAVTNIGAGMWKGYDPSQFASSFQIPLSTSYAFLPESTYAPTANGNRGGFIPLTNQVAIPPEGAFYVPRWSLNLHTRLRFILVDYTNIVDYVNLDHAEDTLDLTAEMIKGANCVDNSVINLWCTNRLNGAKSLFDATVPTFGMDNQFLISAGMVSNVTWRGYNFDASLRTGTTKEQAIGGFYYNIFGEKPLGDRNSYYRSNDFFAPFVPVFARFTKVSWQANDPLVHYTLGDLMNLQTVKSNAVSETSDNPPLANLGQVNTRYEPWGGNPAKSAATDFDYRAKDPLVWRSDAWEFPTNKFPNVGWLGRVHRGTPWQTVYLKSPEIDLNSWMKWTGNPFQIRNYGSMDTNILAFNAVTNDAAYSLPVNDRVLLDIFTTAFNDNAARGRMSINQTNLAAWSAILSGVLALSNTNAATDLQDGQGPGFQAAEIRPAGVYNSFAPSNTFPAVARIVHGINHVRSTNTAKVFTHLGDFLAAPELTVASPFLNTSNAVFLNKGISDAAYERIPQQILGLLKCDAMPRFIVYSYGQALKPADRSVVTAGPYFGLCTNYQITAEVATRAVVRIEGAPRKPHAIIESFNVLPPD